MDEQQVARDWAIERGLTPLPTESCSPGELRVLYWRMRQLGEPTGVALAAQAEATLPPHEWAGHQSRSMGPHLHRQAIWLAEILTMGDYPTEVDGMCLVPRATPQDVGWVHSCPRVVFDEEGGLVIDWAESNGLGGWIEASWGFYPFGGGWVGPEGFHPYEYRDYEIPPSEEILSDILRDVLVEWASDHWGCPDERFALAALHLENPPAEASDPELLAQWVRDLEEGFHSRDCLTRDPMEFVLETLLSRDNDGDFMRCLSGHLSDPENRPREGRVSVFAYKERLYAVTRADSDHLLHRHQAPDGDLWRALCEAGDYFSAGDYLSPEVGVRVVDSLPQERGAFSWVEIEEVPFEEVPFDEELETLNEREK